MPKNGRIAAPVWSSQNYLTSSKIINRLISRTSLNKSDFVIEIGSGKGHITSALIKHCRLVTSVELDKQLYLRLKDKYSCVNNLTLINQDFLDFRLPESEAYKVFSNIPFCITTDIVRKLTENKNPPEEAWLIMEKGAAKRFIGKPNETLRSLLLKPLFEMDITYYFSREDFHPKPSVDCVMLHLKKKAQPEISIKHFRSYKQFIANCLKNGGLRSSFTKNQLSKSISVAGIHGDFIIGRILYSQWLCLFRSYQSFNSQGHTD